MRKNTEQYMIFVGKIMVLLFLFINAWVLSKYYFNFIDSDDASELVLARLLASEGHILSRNWYYSTEIRVFNTQLIYTPLFYIFSNYKTVRIIGHIILSCLLLISYYLCLYGIEKDRACVRFWKSAFLLLVPIGEPWIFLALKTYYIPHVCVSFLALGMVCMMLKEKAGRRRRLWLWTGNAVLGFIAGLGGIRSLQVTYIPLILVICVYEGYGICREGKKNDRLVQTIWSFVGPVAAFAGYLVNEFWLREIYYFDSFDHIRYDSFVFSAVEGVINAYLETMGYTAGIPVFSFDGICNILAWVFVGLMMGAMFGLLRHIKEYYAEKQMVILFVMFSFGLNIFVFIVTGEVASRYVMLCLTPAILLLLFSETVFEKSRDILTMILWVAVIVMGIKEYRHISQMDENENRRSMLEYISNQEYTYGYATFWNANIVTELTNGKINFQNLDYWDSGEITKYNWLTPVVPTDHEGPVIGVFQKWELEQIDFQTEMNVVFDDDEYIIYEFASDEDFDRAFGF